MKLLAVFGIMLSLFVTPALATPPDLICSGGSADEQIEFVVPLMTGHSSIYSSGVAPMSAHHIQLVYWRDTLRVEPEIYGEHMVAEWLLDGRTDLRFYLEELDKQGESTSYDLIIRTKATGQVSSESGQNVHHGFYEFRVYSGSFSQGSRSVFIELVGDVVCE